MLALQVTNMKQFMGQLLTKDSFDPFLLEEAVLATGNTFTIDGRLNRDFYTEEELCELPLPDYEFTPWSKIKGLCFDLIKGKHTPLSFKFVFHLKQDQMLKLLARQAEGLDPAVIRALVLTVRYDGGKAVLTTGCSYRTFVLSREAEQVWDKALTTYLAAKGIEFELL